jgi:hypothetical protein
MISPSGFITPGFNLGLYRFQPGALQVSTWGPKQASLHQRLQRIPKRHLQGLVLIRQG